MRPLTVVGLTSDGLRLVLRSGNDTFELALRDVPTGRQASLPFADQPAPSVREIQQRIRGGESSTDIAERSGLPLEHVVRYEGPVLAEREYQATRAQRARVDGRPVGELVAEHMARLAQDPAHLSWDAWLVEPGRWEVRAQCGREAVRLRWDPPAVKVQAIDEAARHALRLGPASDDALGAVLRPVSSRPAPARTAAVRAAPARSGPSRADLPRTDPPRTEPPRTEPPRTEPPRTAPSRTASGRAVPAGPAADPGAAPADQVPALDEVPAVAVASPTVTSGSSVVGPPGGGSRRVQGRPKRAAVPAWGDITAGVAGRGGGAAAPTRED